MNVIIDKLNVIVIIILWLKSTILIINNVYPILCNNCFHEKSMCNLSSIYAVRIFLYSNQLQLLDLFGKIEYDPKYDYKKQRKRS